MRFTFIICSLFCAQLAGAQTGKQQISLDDIWKNKTFAVKTVPGFNAMKDGGNYTQINREKDKQTIQIYSLLTGKPGKIIFDNSIHKYNGTALSVDEYAFSNDEKQLLLFTESENIYRRSILYKTYVMDLKTGKISLLHEDKVLHATFSPNGEKIAFVRRNNLYIKDLKSGQTIPVTEDGAWNKVINGNCDWVYEEEFSFTRAFEWSPNSSTLAYYRFDESGVREYSFPVYGSLYPDQYTYKYPKAGEANSIIQIRMYDLKTAKTATADIGTETDQYIPRIKWSNDPQFLCIERLNRRQNKLELLLTNTGTGKSEIIYVEENPYYIDINDNIRFLPDNESFIFNSEQSGYNHLYRWNWKKQQITRLTEGNYDVDDLLGVDTRKNLVYYTAAEAGPMERKLYTVTTDGNDKKCLTPENGMHNITLCQGFSYFLDRSATLTTPPVYHLRNASGKIERTLEDNKALKAKMEQYALGNIRFITVKGTEQNLNGWMITPPDFDSTKKHPVLMFQYSGPNSQQVLDDFPARDYFWHQMLAEKGYIIVCVDGTGTGARGQEFRKKTYLSLGKYESDDQIAVARNLGNLPYVDRSRIGIWGWSYGGFMSSICILKGNDVFKMAVAVAPVTNWRYYDNIYTERYMRTPQENAAGYDENAPEKMADRLKGDFLIIHGTADDNVHFQNAVMLTDALIKAGKRFESEYYPNKNHGVYGGNTRHQLYQRMTDFILGHL